ncbi:low temperature requirement protein A [Nocardia sp. CA2R105]|uniref:low temperature requirement protein A n=1 Tax=Nocardia coffeae TaxID=2873381 RepID=UPI001CA78218|nr:low temperature requirement protein A [Nocardia coffeae]MBY8862915.1 low temperature requirement protein A [Nocardia coffeae]
MSGRDPGEPYRASTPLELLFDLCFVVAVAQTGAQLHHSLEGGHIGAGLLGYAMVFFVIWWAWVNFVWFASAYDTDDVPYRLLTLVQIAGVLVLSAGVPAAFQRYDFRAVAVGYLVIRVAMIGQWLRAAQADPAGRPAALRYAVGISVLQICWLLRLFLPAPWSWVFLVVLVIGELAVPVWAQFRGNATSWHPGHIRDRYGCFTLIVLGEAVASETIAVQSAITDHGLSPALLVLAFGGLLLIFALWWSYFAHEATESLRASPGLSLLWGYVHYGIFAAVAAVGAGLSAATDSVTHTSTLSSPDTGFAVAVPVACYLLLSGWLRRQISRVPGQIFASVLVGVLLVLAAALLAPASVPLAVLAMGVVVALILALNLVIIHRSSRTETR